MRLGNVARAQLALLSREWEQGQHVLITGGTGSGKTRLARELDEIRIQAGSYVVVFVCKLQPDDTLRDYYKGWTRWTTWKKKPRADENRILLWPKVEGKTITEAKKIMKDVFADAIGQISKTGYWTVHFDEGLFLTSPAYLNFGEELGMLYALMRSARATLITLAQRPAHLPLSIYANIDHAFIGRANEPMDLKRLGNMSSHMSSRELSARIGSNGKHDFTWIRLGSMAPPVTLNLAQ